MYVVCGYEVLSNCKMKKTTIFAILFLSLVTIASAQESGSDSRSKIHVGAKAGLSYSNVYDTDGDEFEADAKLGFTGGVFVAIPIGKFLGIQPELLLTQKGYKSDGSFLGSSYSYKRTTTFLEVPILLAVKPVEMITLLVGPQFSYLVKNQSKFSNSIIDIDQEEEFEQDNIRKNILGVVGGLDVNLMPLVLSARVGWDLQNNKGDGTSTDPRYKNVSSQITIGFKF